MATACDAKCNAGMCMAMGYGKCDVGQCADNYGRASDGSCVGKEQSWHCQQTLISMVLFTLSDAKHKRKLNR